MKIMTRRIKIILFGIAIASLMIGLVLAGFLFYLHTNHAQSIIQTKINEAIPGTISWDRFRISLFTGSLDLMNFQLKASDNDRLAGFDRLFVNISWASLVRGELSVSELILEKPWVTLCADNQERLNLASAFPAPESQSTASKKKTRRWWPIHFTIQSARISNVSVGYEKANENHLAEIQHIDLAADANLLKKTGNFELEMTGGCLNSPKINGEFEQFKIAGTLKENRIHLRVFTAATSVSELTVSGYIHHVFTQPLLDLEIGLNASLPEIQKVLYLKTPMTGRIIAQLNIQGELENPDAVLRLDYGGGEILKNRIDNIHLDLKLKDRLMNLNTLHIAAASGNLRLQGSINLQKAFAVGLLAPKRDLEAISYKFNLIQEGIRLEQLISDAVNLKGTLSSDIDFYGKGITAQRLQAKLSLNVFASQMVTDQIARPVDLHLNAGVNFSEGILSVENFAVVADDLKIQSSGDFDLLSEEFRAELSLDAARLDQTMSLLGIKDVQGDLKLKTDVSGSLKRPIFDFVLQGNKLRFQELTIGNIRVNADLNPSGILNVSQLSLDNQDSSIKGGGTVRLFRDSFDFDPTFPMNFYADFRNIDFKNFLNQSRASGTIDGKMTLSGDSKSLQAKLSLQGKNVAAEDIRFGDFITNARFSKGNLYLDQMEVTNRKSVLRISGIFGLLDPMTMNPLEDPSFEFELEGDTIFIEDFVDTLKGKLALNAHLEGSVAQPRGTIRLIGTNLDLDAQKLEKVDLLSKLDGKRIWIDPIKITVAKDESIEGRGWFSYEKAYQFGLVSKGISFTNIDKILDQKAVSGKIAFDISGIGTFEDPGIKGEIALKNLFIQGKPANDVNLHLDVHDQLASVSANSNFDFNASFHLKKKDFWLSVLFDETDLSPYLKITGRDDFSGSLTGKMEAKGNTEAVERIEGFVDFSQLDLFFDQKQILHSRNFKIFFRNEEIFIPGIRLDLLTEGYIEISGSGELSGPLGFTLNGNLPLQGISFFVKDPTDFVGNISFSANLNGTLPHPDIQADVFLEKIGLTVPALSQKLHDTSGRIRITPQTITIDEIKGQLDTGRFDLAGTIDLEAFEPVRMLLSINANALPIQIPETMNMLLNARLRVEGTSDESTIRGETIILEGTYYKDVNLSLLQAVGQKKREAVLPPSEIDLPFFKNMNLDISISRRYPFIIDNNLAQLEITPDLHVKGNLQNPIVSGRLNIESGTIEYQKKTFIVKKGIIDFINPYKTEPLLDIQSEVNVRNWIIFLEISGTIDQLVFTLRSDPPETNGDILSILALGRTSREMIEGAGGKTQSTEQMLAEIIASTFEKDIKKFTGIDTLEVESGANGDDPERIKVTVGKELSKRMAVKYSTESKQGEFSQRAIAEYKFHENVLLSGFQDSDGTFGGALKYRLEFR